MFLDFYHGLLEMVPTTEISRYDRAKRYVDWAAEHTGILRFQEATNDKEQIRFWHRLFREYLSANRLAQEDTTAEQKISKLWDQGRLIEPFWEDVVRLLPRARGTIEKARSLRQRLERLAEDHPSHRGRLLGLATAGIIENRDLYPEVDFSQLARKMASGIEHEGDNWPVADRLLFLDVLGRLDVRLGDPRLGNERWVQPRAGNAFSLYHGSPPADVDLAFGWAPVTVQEFNEFAEGKELMETQYWVDAPPAARPQPSVPT